MPEINEALRRSRRALKNYGTNAAGKIVRKSAFGECDYTEEGDLRQFSDEKAVIAFEQERYEDGTGCHCKFWRKPKDTVPKESLALEKAMTHAVQEDGNRTRVQLENVEESIHARHDHQDRKLDKLLEVGDRLLGYQEMKAKEVSGRYGWVKARQRSEDDEDDEDDAEVEFYYDTEADEVYRCAESEPPDGCVACELALLDPFPRDTEKVNYKIWGDEERYVNAGSTQGQRRVNVGAGRQLILRYQNRGGGQEVGW